MEQKLNPIHLACADDELRPIFSEIEIKNSIATATNANILVKIDLTKTTSLTEDDLKTLEGKFINREVWKEIYKCDLLEFDDEHIYCHKKGIKKTFDYTDMTVLGKYPNCDAIIIKVKEDGEEAKKLISYNPKNIETLRKIFQSEYLFFSHSKDNNGTICFPYSDSGMFAVLMPCMVGENSRCLFI